MERDRAGDEGALRQPCEIGTSNWRAMLRHCTGGRDAVGRVIILVPQAAQDATAWRLGGEVSFFKDLATSSRFVGLKGEMQTEGAFDLMDNLVTHMGHEIVQRALCHSEIGGRFRKRVRFPYAIGWHGVIAARGGGAPPGFGRSQRGCDGNSRRGRRPHFRRRGHRRYQQPTAAVSNCIVPAQEGKQRRSVALQAWRVTLATHHVCRSNQSFCASR